ncbi:hypothetical protein KOR42_20560 [Thalassoglobus neptunius]|uniref:DUF4190 domain-containing protein n=2 Tax=Thalassoglobus neptunius TaxID=1938619 RepID=A0A5C5X6Z3_9PLAN|nr:hypothetical protein KOR42_20560 [Thalassoglobus neptunius]
MIQVMESPEVEAGETSNVPSDFGVGADGFNEFNYRPVPVIAVSGLVVALLSFIGVFVWLALPLCLIGLVLSVAAIVVIRRSKGAYGGTFVAASGVILSTLFFAGGIALQIYIYQTEVPDGYTRVSFVKDIADKPLVPQGEVADVHPDVKSLDGKKVFLKGYIYQTGKMKDLHSFLFVKDNQDCCFGANPAVTDRVGVVMQDGNSIDYVGGKVAIAGTFRINNEFTNTDQLEPLYILDGELFTTRVSDF